MKPNKMVRQDRRGVFVILGSIVFAAVMTGLFLAYHELRDIYLEQCVIEDLQSQVSITSGKMVKADVIAYEFGLRKGANLALIDFSQKREDILRKIPNLRALTISRKLPDKVTIVAEERTPVARINISGRKRTSGKVVDSEGVVFICQRGTSMLPTIYEPSSPGTQPGQKLKARALAALRLLEACRQMEFQDLGVLDVDISRQDYILATLGDYSRAKIAWEGMDEFNSESKKNLDVQLNVLVKAIRAKIVPGKIWNATIPGSVFMVPKGNVL